MWLDKRHNTWIKVREATLRAEAGQLSSLLLVLFLLPALGRRAERRLAGDGEVRIRVLAVRSPTPFFAHGPIDRGSKVAERANPQMSVAVSQLRRPASDMVLLPTPGGIREAPERSKIMRPLCGPPRRWVDCDQCFLWVGLTDLVMISLVKSKGTIIRPIRSEIGEVLRGCPMEKGDKTLIMRRVGFIVG